MTVPEITVSIDQVTSAALDTDNLLEACLISTGQLAAADWDFAQLAKLAAAPTDSTYSTISELTDLRTAALKAASLSVTESPTLPRAQTLLDVNGGVVVARWTLTSMPVAEFDGDLLRATRTGWEFDTLEDGILPFVEFDAEARQLVTTEGENVEVSDALLKVWDSFQPEVTQVTAATSFMSACVFPVMHKIAALCEVALQTARPLIFSI